MQSIESSVLVSISKAIAPIFDPVVLIVLSLVVAPYIYMKSSKKNGIIFGAMILITGGIIWVLKQTFGRLRPLEALSTELSYSFPSGHATMAVVFFGILIYLFVSKKYRVWGIVVASLLVLFVGFSRLYLRVHWLTDVLGGFIIGGVILAAGIWAFNAQGRTRH